MPTDPSEAQGYAVSNFSYACVWCNSPIDALTAEWCSCVSSKASLSCGACGLCFCRAAKPWWDGFYTSAAATIFRERLAKLTQSFFPVPVGTAGELPRPIMIVVDDDKVVHVVARRVLKDFAGTLLHAMDGETALTLAQQVRPDLVITDALLPKLDGRELSRRLKTGADTRDCKVAVMTALYKGLRYRSEALREFMVDEYAEKPVTANTLRALASRLLAHLAPAATAPVEAAGAAL